MLALTKRQNSSDAYRLLCGTCPDEECQAKLYFPSNEKSIECTNCGQRHDKSLLQNVAEVTGLSNYVCKLISPILTNYGMDRKLGRARLLKDMGKGEMFNCGRILGDRVFLIEEENLDVIGYGKDRSGSIHYLADTLNDIRIFNDNETRLIPIHVDGDGHCLVHAISRALVGRELFWHALRVNLGLHIRDNLASYKQLFKDFIDAEEWEDIIDECDPYYIPPEGEPIGLRNIHIFGLANVLHRPIILLDSKSGMQSPGDYSGVFVPGLVSPEDCRGKDGTLNKPLCIAWSSSGRNHYIPLVGIKGRAPAMLPAYMVQTAWGMPEESIKNYLELDNMDRCVVGGDKCLTDRYIRQLVAAMEEVFIEQNQVHPSLVADVHQFIYKSSGIVCVQPDEVIQRTQQSVRDEVLYRCLTCEALVDAVCSCNAERECIPDIARSHPNTCAFCSGEMLRRVKADGGILYKDGDRTTTPCVGGKCSCGYKHFWQGKEYDNLPELFPISLQWAGKVVSEKVAWFQYETDPTMNRNVYEVAEGLVQKHFPGEFGSERLVQQVVDTILDQTASAAAVTDDTDGEGKIDNEDTASNITITGPAQEEDGAVEDASDLLQGQPYHWKDWCMVRSRDCLYLWSDAAALELYNESNGWFDFILDSKLATMGPGGSTKGRSARAEFLEELQRAQTQVKTGTPSQPIMSRVSAARLVVGNWAITCKKEGEVQIHNSDDQHQATILKEDLPGFIFKSIIGTKHYFTAETSLGPEFSAGWTGKKNKKFRSETDTLSTKVLQNPEMPVSILDNPFVQLIKSNPDVLRQLMTSSPQMRELMEDAVMEIEISDDESLPENVPTYDDSELLSREDYVGQSRKLEPLMPEYVKDEMEALEHFTKVFRDRYGECHPVFYIGPLDNAIRDSCSAKERKLLAIYLHHDGSILSNVFCSQTLCNEGVVNFLTNNFIIWAWDMTLDSNHARLTTLATRHFGSVAATQIRGYSPDNFPVLLIISRSMMTNEVADVIRDVVTVDELMPRLIHDQEVFSEQQRKESTWVEEVLQNTEMRLSIWMNQLIMSYPDELRQRMTSNPQMRECMEMSDIMEDDHRTLSRHLWGILDGIGLCPEERKAVTNRAITREILLTLGNVLAGPKITTYVAGSRYEATTTAGIQSDRDIINVYEDLAVVGDLQHAPQNVLCLWLVTDRSTPAGYTKLQLVENGIPGIVHPTVSFDTPYISVDRLGRVLLNNSWEEYQLTDKEINGPAITYTCKYIIGETVDCVLAFRCASWPDVAREWLTRDRRHNWPTQVQLQELRALGCLFVGVGHCHSTESEQQWRISFTLQERYLMISLNETQYKCYVVMKVINKDFITSQLQDSISSYHFKTVLLYAIESNPAEFWVPGNLVKCILFCLEALYKCAVKGDCPSYFIPEANLFDRRVHGELRKQIVSLLAELLRENGKFLFRINCDNIGIQLSAASTSRAPHIASVLLDTDMLMNHCIRAGYKITLLVTNILYYTHTTSIETLQDQISRLVSTTRVAEHTESETREAVQYILPHLHTRLVSHLAAGIVLRGSGDSTAGNMRTLMEDHIQLAISPGLTSLRLKVATIYYMLEDYNAAERLLTDVAAAIRGPVINVCPCQDPGYKGQPSTHLPDTFEGGKDFVNSHMCYCISFPPSEVAVMPAALQYEMFKSRKTMPRENCLQGKCGLWYAWSNVDAQVFFHYMQYLLYDMLGDVWRRQRALHDMFYVAIDANDHLYHRETAFNLLGWIFKQEGYVNMAARCFLRSILIEPEDNAAKWHIADLYLRQSKASRRAPLALTLPMISY